MPNPSHSRLSPKPQSKNPQKPVFSLDKPISLYEKPLVPQLSSWLLEAERTAKRLKTGRLQIRIDFYSE